MRIIFAFLLLILLCSIDCVTYPSNPKWIYAAPESSSPIKNYSIFIDVNFNSSEQEEIKGALSSWNFALTGHITFNVVSTSFDMSPQDIAFAMGSGIMILKIDPSSHLIPDSVPGDTGAWVDAIGTGHSIFVVSQRLEISSLGEIVMHEIGHILGAVHVTAISLMNPIYSHDNYQCIDMKTMQMVSSYNLLRLSSLNYCLRN